MLIQQTFQSGGSGSHCASPSTRNVFHYISCPRPDACALQTKVLTDCQDRVHLTHQWLGRCQLILCGQALLGKKHRMLRYIWLWLRRRDNWEVACLIPGSSSSHVGVSLGKFLERVAVRAPTILCRIKAVMR